MTIAKRNGHFPFIFDDFLNRQFNRSLADYSNTNTTIPAVNIKESAENFGVELAAPGMNKKDFNVQVNGNVLTIRSEKKIEKEEDATTAKYTTREFSYQSFERSFTLPKDTVDTDKIEARYEDGVLYLTIPKKEKEKLEARLIEVS